ncbi:MAG: ribbon-helix-helix domain-containing protein [Lachnospiraceae bacterium]|nr:ribbon-helix-helix domain-containing protein [Lachnospiraceae bacterium]
MKKRVNISLDEDTVERLKELADQSHMNVSQWISQAVWNSRVEITDAEGKLN